ncbi:alpha/beta hydrolase [Roseibacterium sp. KMU-115]|uniref:Alpha/beta hydrolase n=1 Tax=Roseicyclus persicicus TaxID=2650661 RepID=A0A7X6GY97_9RHOB|nr:alpha/beta hydrolase [Roseibacterium persicicum]
MLLLHGVCSTGETMGVLVEAFRARGCIVRAPTLARPLRTDVGALDGGLARLGLRSLLAEARRHAEAVTEGLGRKPLVVGHSNGALLALAIAALGEAEAVGLVAPAPPASVPGAPLWLRKMIFTRVFGTGWGTRAIRFRPRWPFVSDAPGPELSKTLCPDSGPAMLEVISPVHGGPFDPAPPLPCPAVVVAGSRDRLIPAPLTRSLARRFGAAHHTIDGAGHWLIGDEAHAHAICSALLHSCTPKGMTR